jgi:hypothetical protein
VGGTAYLSTLGVAGARELVSGVFNALFVTPNGLCSSSPPESASSDSTWIAVR